MHQDPGNTGSTEYPGPTGANLSVISAAANHRVILFDQYGQMLSGYTQTASGTTTFGLAAVDADTLEIQASWSPPNGDVLNFSYMELSLDNSTIVVASKRGNLYVVQRTCTDGKPGLELSHTYNLTEAGVLAKGELGLNSGTDGDGNIWFTTGGLLAQGGPGDPEQNSTTIGYIEPSGAIHTLHIANQMIENGMAISGTNVFIVTGPSGADDHEDAIGYMLALSPGEGTTITTTWNETYSAGSFRKPFAFARGSGSTPTLLGDQYVVITDNADNQINLIVYHQAAATNAPQMVCSTPVFKNGSGNNDVGTVAHLDDDTYGVVIMNNYNLPPLFSGTGSPNNASYANLSVMASETIRVNISADGSSCKLAWDTPIRIQSVPILSTKTGLVYGYTQDEDSAIQGLWEWYVAALDWRTGEVTWKVRTGAGGVYGDNYLPGALGPDGTFYQGVLEGVVMVKDGSNASTTSTTTGSTGVGGTGSSASGATSASSTSSGAPVLQMPVIFMAVAIAGVLCLV